MKQTAVILLAMALLSCKSDKKEDQLSKNAAMDALIDKGWPRIVEKDGAKLVYYQPQIDEWKDFSTLKGDIAFAITKDNKEAVGIASVQATTLVDKESRQVYLKDMKINDLRFPTLVADSVEIYSALVKDLFPKNGNPVSVDRLLAELEKDNKKSKPVNVKNDPPLIFFSDSPAILLMVPGEPALAPIENSALQYVVNTNWDLFYDKASKDYYMLAGDTWLKTKTLSGPWAKTTSLPADMGKLPSGQGFDDVKKAVPPPNANHAVPTIFYSSKPAEIVLTNGAPKYVSLPGTGLSYINNTENDVLKDDSTGTNYLLLSGRWFAARNLKGPWAYVSDSLPTGFAQIPEDSPMGHVLSSVPGTQQASDAVLLAQVPTTAIVNKADVEKKVKVNYDGKPKFSPIEKTNLQYATNTQEKVIKVGDMYYLCYQGVWFMSAKPDGPWKTAPSVPSEIYSIPPSSPVYNVTYVTQVETSPTTVQSQTTAGYFGVFIMGVAVGSMLCYGSGYYYPPYMYYPPHMYYPVYRPYPITYGVGAVYNPYTGGYAVGRRAYGPYGAAGSSAWYNPSTGRYGRSASVQGWYGGRSAASAYNPWTGAYGSTRQEHNSYAQWGSSVAAKGDDWVRTGHIATKNGGVFGYQTSGGKEGIITRGPGGNTRIRTDDGVYAGHDGNVYKKDNDGNWSKYNNGNWENVDNKPGVGHHDTKGTTRNREGAKAATQPAQPSAKQNLAAETKHQPERTAGQHNMGTETRQAPNRDVNPNLGTATRDVPERTAGQNNMGGATQQMPDRAINPNMGAATSNMPDRTATQNNMGGATQQMPERNTASQANVMQDLQRSDAARQRGEQQTQHFNNAHNSGARQGGGGMRGGGGFRRH